MNDSRPPTKNSIPRLAPRGDALAAEPTAQLGAGGSEVRAGRGKHCKHKHEIGGIGKTATMQRCNSDALLALRPVLGWRCHLF